MGIIEFHKGCNALPFGCFGPWNDFITVFGTEFQFLNNHLIIALLIGLVVFCISYFIYRNRFKLLLTLVSISISIIAFFMLAYFFPMRVIY